jgi:hypothetical protein
MMSGGLPGLLGGAMAGYLLSLLIGAFAMKKSRGLVPLSVRRVTAQQAVADDWPAVSKYLQVHAKDSAVEKIADTIETAYKLALDLNPAGDHWMSRQGITEAFKGLGSHADNDGKRYYAAILKAVLKTNYK